MIIKGLYTAWFFEVIKKKPEKYNRLPSIIRANLFVINTTALHVVI